MQKEKVCLRKEKRTKERKRIKRHETNENER